MNPHADPDFSASSTAWAAIYLLLCAMNWVTALLLSASGRKTYFTLIGAAGPITGHAGCAGRCCLPHAHRRWPLIGMPARAAAGVKHVVNELVGPGDAYASARSRLFADLVLSSAGFSTQPAVAWAIFNLALLVDGPVDDRSELRGDRRQARQRADRGPGVLARLLHLAGHVQGGRSTTTASRRGWPPLEKLDNEKVLVWPDLVYTELICMVALTAFLLVWGIALQAPLEEPASQRQDAQPVEGPVVLPRLAGNARLLRSRGWPASCCPA